MGGGRILRGGEEGPAPGDDNPSSSGRLILFGRTIRFLIDNSRLLASALGLALEGCGIESFTAGSPPSTLVTPACIAFELCIMVTS
jgi:hypothetical protein